MAADSTQYTYYADIDKLPTPGKIGVFFRLQPSEPPKARYGRGYRYWLCSCMWVVCDSPS